MLRVIVRLIVFIGGGALLASPVLLKRWPKLVDSINKVAIYKNGIGLTALFLGIIDVIGLLSLTSGMASIHYTESAILVSFILELIIGFILSYGVIIQRLVNNPKAKARLEGIYDELIKRQSLIGLVAIGWTVVLLIIMV